MGSLYKVIITFFLFLSVALNLYSQSGMTENQQIQSFTMPKVISASPEVANLSKIGTVSNGMFTGAATASIPVYEIKLHGFTLPISLNYQSNGIRVTDIASRVGMGWSLNYGGIISRQIRDEDDLDNFHTVKWTPPSSFVESDDNYELFRYLANAVLDDYDTENDFYYFNVNDLSGSFFINKSNKPVQVKHSNVLIEKSGNDFILTDVNGVKYFFGTSGNIERTKGYSTGGWSRWQSKMSQTGWFLSKIITPENETIDFTYESIDIKTLQGYSQSSYLTNPFYNSAPCPSCADICKERYSAPEMQQLDYETKYIKKIESSSGIRIFFDYESRNDIGGDNRIVGISVSSIISNHLNQIKNYKLEYQDFNIQYDWNQRFYLKKLIELPRDQNISKALIHEFEYDQPEDLPSQRSFSLDFDGYYNHKNSSVLNFFPIMDFGPSITFNRLSEGANRTPDFNFMKKGVLKRIIYPTGGFDDFEYEQHVVSVSKKDSLYQTKQLWDVGIHNSSIESQAKVVVDEFTTGDINVVKMQITASQNQCGPFPGDPNFWLPEGGKSLVLVRLLELNESGEILIYTSPVINSFQTLYSNKLLKKNTRYKIVLEIYGLATYGEVYYKINPTVSDKWEQVQACGLRVKNIIMFDPLSRKKVSKYFKYASVDDMSRSSGFSNPQLLNQDYYTFSARTGAVCYCGAFVTLIEECGNHILVSSNRLHGDYLFNGSTVAYQNVIESDDINFKNGLIQHDYLVGNYTLPDRLIGDDLPSTPKDVEDIGNGLETMTTVYKNISGQLKAINRTKNIYAVKYFDSSDYELENYIVRSRWSVPLTLETDQAHTMEQKLSAFDVGRYKYISSWRYLLKTETEQYDENGTNPIVVSKEYAYNDLQSLLPTLETSKNSKGDIVKLSRNFVSSFNFQPYTTLLAQHILSPLVTTTEYKNAEMIYEKSIDYFNWSNSGLIKPKSEWLQKGVGQKFKQIEYHNIDDYGNPIEFSRDNNTHMSYLWGYKKNFPIAEVVNASSVDIAFTSFEISPEVESIQGGWSIIGNEVPELINDYSNGWKLYDDIYLTGKYSFGGTLSKTISPDKTYEITLWSKGNTTKVNGTNGHLILARKGWSLYQWIVSSSSIVQVSGDYIDEIRLRPIGALMTTYTYEPFIGVTSVNDPNNNIQFYEYDEFNRLSTIRDFDGNILKKADYEYGINIQPCTSNTPAWSRTGLSHCQVDQNNNPNGQKSFEEIDLNNCSETYLTKRWTTESASDCSPVANCNAPNKRVINGVCKEAQKVFVSSTYSCGQRFCYYYYEWEDGFRSDVFQEITTGGCDIDITPL